MTLTLREYIQYLNARTRERQLVHGGVVFLLVENLEHWARYGITTVEQLDEYLDECAADARAYNWDDADAVRVRMKEFDRREASFRSHTRPAQPGNNAATVRATVALVERGVLVVNNDLVI